MRSLLYSPFTSRISRVTVNTSCRQLNFALPLLYLFAVYYFMMLVTNALKIQHKSCSAYNVNAPRTQSLMWSRFVTWIATPQIYLSATANNQQATAVKSFFYALRTFVRDGCKVKRIISPITKKCAKITKKTV